MANVMKLILFAIPVVVVGAALAASFPEMRRYMRMRRM